MFESNYNYFPIDDFYTVYVKKFYTLEELEEQIPITLLENPDFLWMGILGVGGLVGVCIQTETKHYGKIAIQKDGQIHICAYDFEKFMQYAQDDPVEPELFAAKENDIVFFKKRLEEGCYLNSEYDFQSALYNAAYYNAHEVLALLLQYGIRLTDKDIEQNKSWIFDDQTKDLLEQYS